MKSTKSLKAKAVLKPAKKPKKQTKPTISKLKREADFWFSRYVRYRDGKKINGEWYSQCITSGEWLPFKKAQAGHFMSRRYNSTRYEEENVNAQSYRDNVLFNGEQYKYSVAVDLKYGAGTAKKLAKLAKIPRQFTIQELERIINDCKTEVEWYERTEN